VEDPSDPENQLVCFEEIISYIVLKIELNIMEKPQVDEPRYLNAVVVSHVIL